MKLKNPRIMDTRITDLLEQKASSLGIDLASNDFPRRMDEVDSLKEKRDLFHIPKKNTLVTSIEVLDDSDAIYMTGNSLGLMPKSLDSYLQKECEKWKRVGVQGHFNGDFPWLTIDDYVQSGLEKVVGAKKGEVGAMNTLTTNLHLLMVPFYNPTPDRYKLMMIGGCFPSDRYLGETNVIAKGFDPKDALIFVQPEEGSELFSTESILEQIRKEGDSVALILFSGVKYNTGQFFDIEKITTTAHEIGAFAGFDLAHAAGNVILKLHDWDVDFACWCSYKYLNSGPGGIGCFFVHEKHNDKNLPRYGGWWGHNLDTRFTMTYDFDPIPGAYGYRLSNPNVLAVMSLYASLETFADLEMEQLREKSVLLTGYLEYLIDSKLDNVTIITPRNPDERGCQLSIKIDTDRDMTELEDELADRGVICDVRGPIIRVAPTPLYNSFQDVWDFANILEIVLTK